MNWIFGGKEKKMSIITNIIQEKLDGLYMQDIKILNFVPRLVAVRESIKRDNIAVSYDIAIYKNGEQVDYINTKQLYIKNWFQFSKYCPSASLNEKTKYL